MNYTCLKLAAVAGIAAATAAHADVKLNENFSTSGYIGGSYRYVDPDAGESTDRFDIDAAKLLFTAAFKPVTGVMSFYYAPNSPEDVTLLDAYATYDAGNGITITGGKFLSWLGYEAFDIVNMSQISYANGDFLGPIPGYHTGVKVEYGSNEVATGFAVLDSVYSGPYYLKGDGELKHNGGFEGYVVYKAIPDLTLWAGFAYDTEGSFQPHSVLTLDVWAQYQVSKAVTVAGEFVHKDGGDGNTGYNWLAYLNLASSDKVSTTFRLSGEELDDDGPGFVKATVSPSYKVSDNLIVRAEVSYYDYKNTVGDSALFLGVQSIFKF